MPKGYVVRRDFKAGGLFYPVGSFLEDITGIKNFKMRVNEGLLVPLPDDEVGLENLTNWFAVRTGVDLNDSIANPLSKGLDIAATQDTVVNETTPPPGTNDVVAPEAPASESTVESDGGPGPEPVSATPETPKTAPATVTPKVTPPVKPATKPAGK